MPSELYRTYEVLIEESVSPNDKRRGKTHKAGRWSPEIARALRDTNDVFQDAVCYYTLLLAGLAGDGRDRDGNLLNPLWLDLRSSWREQTDRVVKRLASRYAPLAGVSNAEEFLARLDANPSESIAGKENLLGRAYLLLEKNGTTTGPDGIPECEKLSELANNFLRRLCDPETKQADSLQTTRNENYFAQLAATLRAATPVMRSRMTSLKRLTKSTRSAPTHGLTCLSFRKPG